MRAKKYHYQRHQEYYNDFVFLPMPGLQRHNGFVYKVYAGMTRNIKQVFDHPLNQEVLDRNYAVNIVSEVKSKGLPGITHSIECLSATLKSLKKLMRVPSYDKSFLKEQIIAVHQLQSLLVLYKRNLLKAMAGELQIMLNSSGFTPTTMVSSHDLQHVLQLMHSLDRELGPRISHIGNMMPGQPQSTHHAPLIERTWEEFSAAILSLGKFEQTNAGLIYLVKQWQNTRMIHEQQEILN